MRLRAMIFDLDNTLYPASSGVMQRIDQRIGIYLQQRLGIHAAHALQLRRTYWETFGTTLRGLLHNHTDIETDEYLEFVHDVEIEDLLHPAAALDAALAALPVRKVVFTNSPREHAQRVLEALQIAHHFERIFDLRYFDFVGKPDPAAYQHVLDYLDVPGPAAMMLEDTLPNLLPAKALGITTVLVGPQIPAHPAVDYHVFDELQALQLAHRLNAPHRRARPAGASIASIGLHDDA